MDSVVKIELVPEAVVVHLEGKFNLNTVADSESALHRFGTTSTVVESTLSEFIDSTIMAVVLPALRSAASHDRPVVLVVAEEAARPVKLPPLRLFPAYGTRADALAAVRTRTRAADRANWGSIGTPAVPPTRVLRREPSVDGHAALQATRLVSAHRTEPWSDGRGTRLRLDVAGPDSLRHDPSSVASETA